MHLRMITLGLLSLGLATARQPRPKPVVPVPDSFQNQPAEAARQSEPKWWQAFGDPLLDELMDRIDTSNLDLRKAASRLVEAQAQRAVTKSSLLPSLNVDTSAAQLRGGFNQGVARITRQPGSGSFVTPFETTVISTGFNLRWEADIFGGLRKSVAASSADARAAAEAFEDAKVLVRSELARNYVEMRGWEEQIAVINSELKSQQDLLELIRVRTDAGLATELEVERQASQVATTQSLLPDLDQQRLAAVHRIGVLLGEEPGMLRTKLEASAGIRLHTPQIPGAIPGELLKRRPDIRRADEEITAAFARTGAARAELYPKFVITGLSGRQSTDFGGLTLGAGNFFSVGPGISFPIFNGGQIRSNIRVQDARLQQSLTSYEETVLLAFEETENAYVARRVAAEKVDALEAARTASHRSVELARELYTAGLGDYLSVVDAERQQLLVERELVSARTAVLRSTVALNRALGR